MNMINLFLVLFIPQVWSYGPVVIVPGTGGSQLEAKLDRASVLHDYCEKKSDWYLLWLSISQLLPPTVNCWSDNIKLVYEKETAVYRNTPGVETRIVDWGSTTGFEYLDPSVHEGEFNYMHTLVEHLVTKGGLERNVTLRGAPYDFRYGPQRVFNGTYLTKMSSLIEETYANAGNAKVSILSHSLGCIFSLYFLNHKDEAWKAKYIRQWIPTSGVFGGTGEGIQQLLSGTSAGSPVSALKLRKEQRSWESSMLLVPSLQAYGETLLVQTPSRNYTASDYKDLFRATDIPDGYKRWREANAFIGGMAHPSIPVTHLYGVEVKTPTSFRYQVDTGFNEAPAVTMGNGDGTVGIDSLELAQKLWMSNTSSQAPFHFQTFPGSTHTDVLKDQVYLAKVLELLG